MVGVRPRVAWWVLSLSMLAPAARGQEPVTRVLRAGTEVHLRLLEPVGSNTHKRGDRFGLEVVDAVVVDGDVVIPAGAQGGGEVVHADKSGFGGRAGELILVSRFVDAGDQVVKLRSFSAGSGEQRVNLAMGLSFALVGVFVTGKDIALPVGTDVFAKVALDTPLPPVSIPEATILTTTEPDKNEPSQQ